MVTIIAMQKSQIHLSSAKINNVLTVNNKFVKNIKQRQTKIVSE